MHVRLASAAKALLMATCALTIAGCATPTLPVGGAPPVSNASAVVAAPPEVAAPVAPKRLPKIGLALGGGATRGFAHVGVIQALEQAGIKADVVAGTSAGSLVAALYATGKSGSELQKAALAMDEAAIADWTLPIFSRGVLRGEALARYVNGAVGNRLIENMQIPLGILATELKSGKGVLFRRGDTGTAVRASSSVPSVFLPVKIGALEYVDGGLVAPVPVRFVRQMGADLVIAVDISALPEGNVTDNAVQMVLQTTAIMGKSINEFELQGADVVVLPLLPGMKGTDFSSRQKTIDAGRAAMQLQIPRLRELMLLKSR